VGGIFILKFSTEMLIRTMNWTLTHNVKVLCARFNGAKHVLPAGAVYLAGFW